MTDTPFLVDRKGLTLAGCQAALAEAAKHNLAMTIAILDAGGQLLQLVRMDRIHAGTVDVSIAKARSAVQFKRSTREFQDGYEKGAPNLTALPGVIPFAGGVPLIIDGHIVGAVGASGASRQWTKP